MTYQLHWNEDTKSGFVRNDIYPKGYVFEGVALKPVLPFAYHDLMYDEAGQVFFIVYQGNKIELLETTRIEVLNACSGFVDTTYITVEHTIDILKAEVRTSMEARFNTLVNNLTPNTTSHEMVSWTIQETEARAWSADNSVPTPNIDILLASRGFEETKAVLIATIIGKADYYSAAYFDLLGQYHRVIEQVNQATAEELPNVVWGI